ncbi:uncharacterized protein LOC117178855 [Belonocnema kinseyi]|uniref:uncharacterized protein LOC117178855 n=1 Tax=Belonocnema kinseyi TaxID=2817044 RepID=UPI00143D869F|nr:uncharacterized protein LOC117178855 [Belonocnema kinseyi]
MRGVLSLFMLFAALFVATCNYISPFSRPGTKQPRFPQFPGGTPPFNPLPGSTGPFIPRTQPFTRFRRSPEDKNKITANANKEGGKSAYQIEYERKLYENEHGSVSVNTGVNKNPYSKPQSHVGVSGSFSW